MQMGNDDHDLAGSDPPFESSNLGLDLANDRVRGVSGNDLGVVKHVELLGSITAGIEQDGLLSSGVVAEEAGNV